MLLKSLQLALLASSAFLLAASPPDAAARTAAPRTAAPQHPSSHVTPRLIVTLSVNRSGNEATYGVSLRNPGNGEVRDVYLAATIAADTTFMAPGPNPTRSGFKGVEGNAAVWLSEAVPAYSTASFSYRVRLSGDTAEPVRAWVHWLRPGDGTALSLPVRVLPGFTAGPLATISMDALLPGPLMWRVQENTVSGAQGAAAPNPGVPQPRIIYILEGVRHFAQDGVSNSFGPGSAHVIKPGVPLVSANRTDAPQHWLAFYLESTASRGMPSNPNDSYSYESEDLVGLKSGPYDMTLLRGEWQPGAGNPLHHYPGPVMVYLLEGTVAHTDEGVTRTINAGEFWVEQAGAKVTAKNTGSTKAVAIAALLTPKGEAPAIFDEPANPLSFR